MLFDQAIKVALIVGWVVTCGLTAVVLAGSIGVALRKGLGLRWVLSLLLPALNLAVLVVLVRVLADENSILPDFVLMLFGAPVVTIAGLAAALLVALPPRITAEAATPQTLDDEILRPRQGGRSNAALFREGMTAPISGWHVLGRHPALWRYAIIPVALNLLITLLILVALVSVGVFFALKLHPLFDPTWTDRLLEAVTILVLIIFTVGGTLAAWVLLNGILCGYYYGKLAREVEIRLGMPPEQMRDITFKHQVIDTFRDLGAVIAINLGVLALNVVPGLGTVIAFPVGAYCNLLLLGKDFLDFPLGQRGLRRDEKWQTVKRRRYETLGLGAAVFLFQLIPILGAIVSATAVVGAVVLNRRWTASTESDAATST